MIVIALLTALQIAPEAAGEVDRWRECVTRQAAPGQPLRRMPAATVDAALAQCAPEQEAAKRRIETQLRQGENRRGRRQAAQEAQRVTLEIREEIRRSLIRRVRANDPGLGTNG